MPTPLSSCVEDPAMSNAEPTASNKSSGGDYSDTIDDGLEEKDAFRIRSYQLEMLEESTKRNIIVAVGKNLPKDISAMVVDLMTVFRWRQGLERRSCTMLALFAFTPFAWL